MEKERTEEKKERLTLGSLFDGSAGFPLGGLLAEVSGRAEREDRETP